MYKKSFKKKKTDHIQANIMNLSVSKKNTRIIKIWKRLHLSKFKDDGVNIHNKTCLFIHTTDTLVQLFNPPTQAPIASALVNCDISNLKTAK